MGLIAKVGALGSRLRGVAIRIGFFSEQTKKQKCGYQPREAKMLTFCDQFGDYRFVHLQNMT